MIFPFVPTPSSSAGRLLVLAAEGALVCTAGDQLHVHFGVLSYRYPYFAGQGWWTLPIFFASVLAMLVAYPVILRATTRVLAWPAAHVELLPSQARRAIGEFFVAYAATALAWRAPVLLLLALTGAFGLRLSLDWRAADAGGRRAIQAASPFVALVAVVGPLTEATLVAMGEFRYHDPHMFGVAMWLPALYLHAAWAGRATVHAFLKGKGK